MQQGKLSDLAAQLAIEGVVGAIAGAVRGQFPIKPRALDQNQRAEAGISPEGEFLFYPVGEAGLFFYSQGAFTTIWYMGPESYDGAAALDARIKRDHPNAKLASDGPHKSMPGWGMRGYDVKLPNGKLAVVEAAYPIGAADPAKFSIRVTAMAVKN